MKLRRTFTTVEQYASIVEAKNWEKLPEKEKAVVLQRLGYLRKNYPKFAKDYQDWLNKKARKAQQIREAIQQIVVGKVIRNTKNIPRI